MFSNKHKIVIGGILGAAASFASGWFAASKMLESKYSDIAEGEIMEAKAYYQGINRVGDQATPQQLTKALGIEVDEAKEDRVIREVLASYRPSKDAKPPVEGKVVVDGPEVTIEADEVDVNIFVNDEPIARDDYDEELEESMRDHDQPYVISSEVYFEGAMGYEQASVTYYEGDDTLAGSDDKSIDDVDGVVGEDNLHRFGHGSKDPNIVYVRNEKIEVDFEITRSKGEYGTEVMGFVRHSAMRSTPRRFRDGDDE